MNDEQHLSKQLFTVVHAFPSDAQLKVDPTSVTQRWIHLTCATSCTLGPKAYYTWYRNGKHLKYTDEASIVIDSAGGSESQGSYWCEVRAAGNRLTSSAVCECVSLLPFDFEIVEYSSFDIETY